MHPRDHTSCKTKRRLSYIQYDMLLVQKVKFMVVGCCCCLLLLVLLFFPSSISVICLLETHLEINSKKCAGERNASPRRISKQYQLLRCALGSLPEYPPETPSSSTIGYSTLTTLLRNARSPLKYAWEGE